MPNFSGTSSKMLPQTHTPSVGAKPRTLSRSFSFWKLGTALLLALGLAVPATAQDAVTLQKASEAYNSGRFAEAALGFFDVAEHAAEPELQWRAEYFLAHTLFKMGFHHSALVYDTFILTQGPQHPYYVKAVENVLDVMDAVGDKTLIPNLLDREYNAEGFGQLDSDVINRVNFLVALRSHQLEKMEDSEDFLSAVPEESAFYPHARYLRGVQLTKIGTAIRDRDEEAASQFFEQASAAFEEVLQLKASKNGVKYQDLKASQERASVALARVRYAEGKFLEAADLYAKIPAYSTHWREALFEGAYASFVGDDSGRALGQLHTLHSPIFADHLVPESWLLKGYIYFFSCLFEETKAALAQLNDGLGEAYEAVNALLEAQQQPEFYFALLTETDTSVIPATVRTEIRRDDSVKGYRRYIMALESETARLKDVKQWKDSLLINFLQENAQQQRDQLVQTAGAGVRRSLKLLEFALEDIEGRADILQLELARREKELLEANHNLERVAARKQLGRPAVPARNAEYWPFSQEFWPDEIGQYRYTLKNLCPADEVDNSTASR